jgi:hypothetical protein
MKKQNCWEFKECGREPNGNKVIELGICPVSIENKVDRIHGGNNGGRCCWLVAGTFCGGKVQGTFASKIQNCMQCDFYKKVISEEGKERIHSEIILSKLK